MSLYMATAQKNPKRKHQEPRDNNVQVGLLIAREKKNRSTCSVVSDSVTPWTVARQAPLTMGFSRQGCWRGLPFPSLGRLPDSGIKPVSPALQVGSLPLIVFATY